MSGSREREHCGQDFFHIPCEPHNTHTTDTTANLAPSSQEEKNPDGLPAAQQTKFSRDCPSKVWEDIIQT
jgi:hypothetical protein